MPLCSPCRYYHFKERDAIQAGLDAIFHKSKRVVLWDPQLEDVHMNIEQALTQEYRSRKAHTARSRNDQVATDMRLWFKRRRT